MKLNDLAFGRFNLTRVAVAVLSLATSGAWALGLGRLNVQSALGESLRAEIDVASLSAEEESSLKVRVAPPEAFRSSGIDYNQVLATAQIQLSHRANGQPYLRVSSDRPVQEPFIDVILEINWSNGRLVREYTLLFDPPIIRAPAKAAVAMAPVMSPAPSPMPVPAVPVPVKPAPAKPAPLPEAMAPKPARVPAKPEAASVPAPKPATTLRSGSEDYAVKRGDSLSRIAAKTRQPDVSLDQMLVSLYRTNPDAFIDNNMNRLRADSVLRVPSSEAASGISDAEARQVIRAQSADFEDYRQRLAGAAPTVSRKDNERQSAGKVQAAVDDHGRAAPTPDKLTLSKAGSAPAEVKVSKETEKNDSVARVAELTRNVEELKKLSVVASGAASPMPASAPPVSNAPTVALGADGTPAAAAPASQAIPAASAAAAKPPAPVAPAEEPGLLSQLMDSPLVLPLSGVLIALLGGLGLYRLRGRFSKKSAGETNFRESRLQPDSFFGATGGQRVDTRDGSGQASTMSYSLSQLDAIGDVDPVAEADVYLAYGRDLQAEEILKEALRATPERRAIRMKLLEVYAKRRDTKGFEQLATQMYVETHGDGDDWLKTQELGLQIDPGNAMYQPGGAPSGDMNLDAREDRLPLGASTMPQSVMPGLFDTEIGQPNTQVNSDFAHSGMDLDLDLDAPVASSDTSMQATQAMTVSVERAPMEMDFDLSVPADDLSEVPPAASTDSAAMDFDLSEPQGEEPIPSPAAPNELGAMEFDLSVPPADEPDLNQHAPIVPAAMDFDMSSISLDLDLPATAPEVQAVEPLPDLGGELDLTEANDDDDGDPLARKIELADEFRQIGDVEGARDVLLEVIQKASGATRDRAQAMLKEIS